MKLWVTSLSFCMFPGHAVLSLPKYRGLEQNFYYCVNAQAYAALTYTASTSW